MRLRQRTIWLGGIGIGIGAATLALLFDPHAGFA
jgi:hypothetical protein